MAFQACRLDDAVQGKYIGLIDQIVRSGNTLNKAVEILYLARATVVRLHKNVRWYDQAAPGV